jgi:hypothetical protein
MRIFAQAATLGCVLPSGRVARPCEAQLYGSARCYPSVPNMTPSVGIDLALDYGYVLMSICLILILILLLQEPSVWLTAMAL